MPTSGDVTSLGSLFEGAQLFKVPEFQRNFAWGDQNIDHFLADVSIALESEKNHFLGATILMLDSPTDQPNTQYLIIDGQQRLTTIFMFLALLRDKATTFNDPVIPAATAHGSPIDIAQKINERLFSSAEEGNLRFESNRSLARMFKEQILRYPSPQRRPLPERDKPQTLPLRKAYARLKQFIDDDCSQYSEEIDQVRHIYSLFKVVMNQFTILKVTTGSYPESFDVFMTLNSRGQSLGPSDLVKSLLMKEIGEGLPDDELEDSMEEVGDDWDGIVTSLGTGDIDQFLRHYLLATQDKKVQERVIYSIIQAQIGQGNASRRLEAESYLRRLFHKARIYGGILSADRAIFPRADMAEVFETLNPIQDSSRIFMLAIFDEDNGLSIENQSALLRLLEIYTVRSRLIRANNQKMEDQFQEWASVLRSTDAVSRFDVCSNQIQEKLPSDAAVKAQFETEPSSMDLVRVVLHRINKLLDATEVLDLAPRLAHVEHIAPLGVTADWLGQVVGRREGANVSAKKVLYNYRVSQWGNLTILEREINQSVKQKPFMEKVDGTGNFRGYRQSKVEITKDLGNLATWDDTQIARRSQWLCKNFLSIWALQPRHDRVMAYTDFRPDNKDS